MKARGIEVEKLAESDKPEEFWQWYNPLKSLYERAEDWGGRRKATVLVEHEAWQLYRLDKDHHAGIRAVFVTADGRLRRGVASILLSGVAMTSLIDLLVGVRVDHRGLARMLWGVHAVDPSGTLRRYFTDLGLKEQDEVKTRVLPQVVDLIMEKVKTNAAFKELPTIPQVASERAEVATFLDRFEDDFYKYMDAAVKDWEAKHEVIGEGQISERNLDRICVSRAGGGEGETLTMEDRVEGLLPTVPAANPARMWVICSAQACLEEWSPEVIVCWLPRLCG